MTDVQHLNGTESPTSLEVRATFADGRTATFEFVPITGPSPIKNATTEQMPKRDLTEYIAELQRPLDETEGQLT